MSPKFAACALAFERNAKFKVKFGENKYEIFFYPSSKVFPYSSLGLFWEGVYRPQIKSLN